MDWKIYFGSLDMELIYKTTSSITCMQNGSLINCYQFVFKNLKKNNMNLTI